MKHTKPRVQQIDENPVEAIRNISTNVARAGKDIANGVVGDFWNQMLGIESVETKNNHKLSGDLIHGQEVSLHDIKKAQTKQEEEPKKPRIEAGIDYAGEILHGAKRIESKENQELSAKVTEIVNELKRLVSTSKTLEIEFKGITTQHQITKTGKYYVSFFEWMLTVIKQARMKVEDSGAWLAATKGKHAKKGSYWKNSDEKVGGTSFSLSNERTVATQTG